MSSKISIERDFLESIRQHLIETDSISNFGAELSQLLNVAAPVVERQPEAGWTDETGNLYRLCPVAGGLQIKLSAYGEAAKWESVQMTPAHALTRLSPLYTAPPELAELQATIDKLTAEIEARDTLPRDALLMLNGRPEMAVAVPAYTADRMRRQIEQCLSERKDERLKGGQGEPVIHGGKLDEYDSLLDALDPESVCPYLSNGDVAELVSAVRTLQSGQLTQPAPVSSELVQLLERAKVYARGPFLDEINACLEKQPAPVAEPWNGEGLPPVGAVCEYLFQPGHVLGEEVGTYLVRDREWVKAEVLLHHEYDGKKFAVIHAPAYGFRGCSDTTGEMFRPIACLDKELNQ